MEISQTLLGLMFVFAVAVGVALGFVYDVFRLTRILLDEAGKKCAALRARQNEEKSSGSFSKALCATVLFLEDVLFFVIAGVALVLVLYYANDGQFRGIAPLGMAAGFFVYYNTVGHIVRRVSVGLARLILRAVAAVLKLVRRVVAVPIGLVILLWRITLGGLIAKIHRAFRKRKIEKNTSRCLDFYLADAKNCFGVTLDTRVEE